MNDRRLKKRGTKNGKDVWSARIDLAADADGRRRRTRFTFVGAAKDAQAAFSQCLSQIDRGEYVANDRTTLGQYVRTFLEATRGELAATTWQYYESIARTRIIPDLGSVPLQKLAASNLNKTYATWRESVSAQTVLHHHRFIHRVLAQAVREGLVTRNVAAIATKPKAPSREMRCLSPDEIGRLRVAAVGSHLAPVIEIALASGARRGELVGLKWEDFDAARGTLAIRRSLEQTKAGGVAEKLPKSGKARVVQLPAGAVELLRVRRRELASIKGRIPAGPIFPDPINGGAWAPHRITDGFREVARKAGLAPVRVRPTTRIGRRTKGTTPKPGRVSRPAAMTVTFHALRHTCASLLLAANVHPKVVQERLGHSSIAITMDLYSHVTPSMQTDAAVKLDDILRRAGTDIG